MAGQTECDCGINAKANGSDLDSPGAFPHLKHIARRAFWNVSRRRFLDQNHLKITIYQPARISEFESTGHIYLPGRLSYSARELAGFDRSDVNGFVFWMVFLLAK
jgi:hypothetical protein